MDPYLEKLAIAMMDAFKSYEELNLHMKKLEVATLQFLKEGGVLSKTHIDAFIVLLQEYDKSREQYFIAKRIYEREVIEIAKETAEANLRVEASKRSHALYQPLQNGTFGVYGFPSELNYNVEWL